MKKVVLFFIVSIFFAVNANAEVYLSAKVGGSFVSGDYEEGVLGLSYTDSGVKGSFEAGYKADFTKFGLRVGLEYDIYDKIQSDELYVYSDELYVYIDYTDINAYLECQRHSIHANIYVDFKMPINIISPYIGVGIGAGIVDATAYATGRGVKVASETETYFGASLQAMLGVAINVHKNIAIDVGYKLNYFIKPEDSNNVSLDLLSNDISVGLRFTF